MTRTSLRMKTYAIGIDLGTTNSVIAATRLGADAPSIELLPIPQLTSPGTVESLPILPSFLYRPTQSEISSETYLLDSELPANCLTGAIARRQSADLPMRTVAAAKSWLCHSRVDRHEPILPWGAPEEVDKLSPVEVAQRYLSHLVWAWNRAHPEAPLVHQRVTLTVPASFDASARELTREAARLAGLPEELILLEEPQAAVYAWLADTGEAWRQRLKEGDVLLVCDVGGGTTDFTLLQVAAEDGELVLQRVAVGNHILVGGDNMDLALAHLAGQKLTELGHRIDAWQSVALWHACRAAKEALLSEQAPDACPVTIPGRGSRLIGGSISTELRVDDIMQVLVEGFFPFCDVDATPSRRPASGFQELGLPFESDPAVTRHLAHFLRRHGPGQGESVQPTKILFNGGCLKAPRLRQRLLEVFQHWSVTKTAPEVLEGNDDLDYAVARGAAVYGFSKEGKGVRIRGGAARAYYVGMETAGLAVPGIPRPLNALCVVPFGLEEGMEVDVPSQEIGLVVGVPAHFRFFRSSVRKKDTPGTLLTHWIEDDLEETDSLEATLPAAEGIEGDYVPVRFRSRITELGVFELWCVSTESEQKWKLEFSVREDSQEA